MGKDYKKFMDKMAAGLDTINSAILEYEIPNPAKNIAFLFVDGKFGIAVDFEFTGLGAPIKK